MRFNRFIKTIVFQKHCKICNELSATDRSADLSYMNIIYEYMKLIFAIKDIENELSVSEVSIEKTHAYIFMTVIRRRRSTLSLHFLTTLFVMIRVKIMRYDAMTLQNDIVCLSMINGAKLFTPYTHRILCSCDSF